ncbi:hypothetical protein PR048_032333 [Dryococelus australis]|uniref:Uncharacterized protein n=1 Tax=Dryococelus australis TaxID=614101 RepID=A0ABQ9G1X6_9NEOP|nr:hypothetical protein PR048_032333 [Dryococelus australis]
MTTAEIQPARKLRWDHRGGTARHLFVNRRPIHGLRSPDILSPSREGRGMGSHEEQQHGTRVCSTACQVGVWRDCRSIPSPESPGWCQRAYKYQRRHSRQSSGTSEPPPPPLPLHITAQSPSEVTSSSLGRRTAGQPTSFSRLHGLGRQACPTHPGAFQPPARTFICQLRITACYGPACSVRAAYFSTSLAYRHKAEALTSSDTSTEKFLGDGGAIRCVPTQCLETREFGGFIRRQARLCSLVCTRASVHRLLLQLDPRPGSMGFRCDFRQHLLWLDELDSHLILQLHARLLLTDHLPHHLHTGLDFPRCHLFFWCNKALPYLVYWSVTCEKITGTSAEICFRLSTNKIIRSPLKVPRVHAARQYSALRVGAMGHYARVCVSPLSLACF